LSRRTRAETQKVGFFVVLVGPDGVGKTSLAQALVESYEGPTAYFHFRPPILQPMDKAPPETASPASDKNPPSGIKMAGWLRLGKHMVLCWVGHLASIRPARRRGTLVIGDRWSYGYLVQPLALRFYGPAWMAAFCMRLLPTPDLVVNLTAPVPEIRRRKQELTEEAIRTELAGWPAVGIPNLLTIEATTEPIDMAQEVLRELS